MLCYVFSYQCTLRRSGCFICGENAGFACDASITGAVCYNNCNHSSLINGQCAAVLIQLLFCYLFLLFSYIHLFPSSFTHSFILLFIPSMCFLHCMYKWLTAWIPHQVQHYSAVSNNPELLKLVHPFACSLTHPLIHLFFHSEIHSFCCF